MRRLILIIGTVSIVVVAGCVVYLLAQQKRVDRGLVLHGNIDLRQVELSFNGNERIAEVLVQEGDCVKRGQVLARLTTSRLQPQVDQAVAQVDAQRHAVERLHNGSRPEEIAESRANVQSAEADLANARQQSKRLKGLAEKSAGEAVSQQELDAAQAKLDMSDAALAVNRNALELAVAGPRKEDIAQAEAQLRIQEAGLAFLRVQLADAELLAPVDAVVRTRIMEPGEMASPQRAVFMLAIVDPKWVRAYVSETSLGKVHPAARASVMVDSFPERRFEGWVGYISSVAEFTPKNVETEELRSNLVYEVRVWVQDPSDELRLGMPATVYLQPGQFIDPDPTHREHGGPPTPPVAEAGNAAASAPASRKSTP